MLIDGKQRRYLITLTEGAEFHSHAGYVAHSEIVGLPEGKRVESTRGARYIALRPTLEDFVIEMPRGAQVIYPKDLAPICMLADIAPGIRVFESGVGSGALSMTMLRWGAEIVGYELREDFAQRARANVSSFLGAAALDRYHVRDHRSSGSRSSRTVAHGGSRGEGATNRRNTRGVHAFDHPSRRNSTPDGQPEMGRNSHTRGASPRLVHRG
jgi:tRNA A58 N-methylase Trm61